MKWLRLALSLGLLAACTTRPEPVETAPPIITEIIEADELTLVFTEPVERLPQVTPYSANFPNQLRAPGMITQQAYLTETLEIALNAPWSITSTKDGTLFITERLGQLVIVDTDLNLRRLAIPLTLETSNQGGVLDLALSNDFDVSRTLFLSLATQSQNGSTTSLARAVLSPSFDAFTSFELIFEARAQARTGLHYGSRLVVLPDDTLLMSIGDRNTTRALIQDVNTDLGKVLHLSARGERVVDARYPAPGVFAMGLRNPQGLALNPLSGELYNSDMGPQAGDEINVLQPGFNYGWPIISHGLEYNGRVVGDGLSAQDGLQQPVYVWDPAIAPSGMAVYVSDAMPEWTHDLFVGALRGRHLVRLKLKDGRVMGEERLLSEFNERIRDVHVTNEGMVYIISDAGRLHRLRAED